MKRLQLMVLAMSIMCPVFALAQTAPPTPPPAREEALEASYVGVAGNASSSAFGLGADLIARPDSWLFRNKVGYVRNEADGVLTAKALDYRSRAEKKLATQASAFGEYEFFRDQFAGIDNRNSVTGGLSLKAVDNARQTLAFDAGVGYINEHRLAGVNVSSGSYLLGSAYLLHISDTATLSDDVQMSGVFSDAGDWRLAHTISLTARIAGGLSLKVSNALRYAHFPPPGFKTTDSVTAVALVAKFSHP